MLSTESPDYDLEQLEMQLLLQGIYEQYGYDFRNYAVASLRRRLLKQMRAEKLATLSGLQEALLHDQDCMQRFLLNVSISVTSLFRDPAFFSAFRNKVVPLLRQLPFIRIWHAGCSTGEEVYSMAILLHEEGLLHHSRLYATDLSDSVLQRAQLGIYPMSAMQQYTLNYQRGGGQASLSDYYTAKHHGARIRSFLKDRIVWAQHNLVSDSSFNEFNVILCRNVLIYFNRTLQNRVHELIYQSLGFGGVLALGQAESIRFTPHDKSYATLDEQLRIYRRVL